MQRTTGELPIGPTKGEYIKIAQGGNYMNTLLEEQEQTGEHPRDGKHSREQTMNRPLTTDEHKRFCRQAVGKSFNG